MSSLLSNPILPLWAWLLIIVLGSLVIIGTTAFLVRTIFLHKRETGFVETFGSENVPQRKVTVRRGRVVPQAGTLSLTGSRFGLNAFADLESDTHSETRSKSPFEWWANVKERHQNRNSTLSQISESISEKAEGLKSSSNTKIYHNKEWQDSSNSLSSKDEKVSSTVHEVNPRSPSPTMRKPRPKPINFSRTNPYQQSRSTLHSRFQTLSRISEASPHTSMVSTSSRQSKPSSRASGPMDSIARPAAALHRDSHQSRSSIQQEYAEQYPGTPNSLTPLSRELTPGSPVWTGSNTSLPQQYTTFTDSERNVETKPIEHQPTTRWKSRLPVLQHSSIHPPINETSNQKVDTRFSTHHSSHKGTVLRKKSLKRSEAGSAF